MIATLIFIAVIGTVHKISIIGTVHKINEMSNKKLKLKVWSQCIALRQQIMTNIKIWVSSMISQSVNIWVVPKFDNCAITFIDACE